MATGGAAVNHVPDGGAACHSAGAHRVTAPLCDCVGLSDARAV